MTNRTLTGIPDLTPNQSQKYLAVNTALGLLEAAATPTTLTQVITSPPGSPNPAIAYLCNTSIPGISNTQPGSYIVYTKPPNSVSPTLQPQVLTASPGLSIGQYTWNGSAWLPLINPSLYGTDASSYPPFLTLLIPSSSTLISSSGQTLAVDGAPAIFPYLLTPGAYLILTSSTAVRILTF